MNMDLECVVGCRLWVCMVLSMYLCAEAWSWMCVCRGVLLNVCGWSGSKCVCTGVVPSVCVSNSTCSVHVPTQVWMLSVPCACTGWSYVGYILWSWLQSSLSLQEGGEPTAPRPSSALYQDSGPFVLPCTPPILPCDSSSWHLGAGRSKMGF